ncbi:hypothetical protein E1B28_003841 [Marasmius oreades]|uniref:Uncharacterized protein n=1 Tax=Marasmius oreades TaxID=181124 RepID=A0A9P7UXE5_9AGAR|nr:uncharacterized protein E1B28_003841 [Marasmius oreades]KAG7096398.1 hypothetical protein E1B28_003841 [Marasmius oreades]
MSTSPDTGRGFGNTLSGGIQDVSALLPLLGTEQCERHVGSALDKGFLYAAATPLSIFGSLGIVKTAFATVLATTTYPFRGANWLADAGFASTGTVSSLVTIQNGTVEYGAENCLRQLLDDQHIGDPELISSVDWSGWERRVVDAEANSTKRVVPWNLKLILASALGSMISMTPYLYLISSTWGEPLAWLFPALRSFGSFLCVVCIQLALQLRIHRIVQSRLLLMKFQKRSPSNNTGPKTLENELHAYFFGHDSKASFLSLVHLRPRIGDLERASCKGNSDCDEMERQHAATLLSFDWLLFLYQVMIIIGMGMVVAGYIGCFNLVGSVDIVSGPYVWVGLESLLSLVRISLWGLNPAWDESTGLRLSLRLISKDMPAPPETEDSDKGASLSYFPLITSPTPIDFVEKRRHHPNFRGVTFVAHPESEFLGAATSYTGPLNRFKSDDISSLLYAVLNLGTAKKVLCTVVVLAHSRASICLVFDDAHSWAISSTYKLLPGTTTLLVTFEDIIEETSILIPREVYDMVSSHARNLASRFFGLPRTELAIKWDLTTIQANSMSSDERIVVDSLTAHDKQYRATKIENWTQKIVFMRRRRRILEHLKDTAESTMSENSSLVHKLHLFLFESFILEMDLCLQDHEFAERRASDRSLIRRLAPEWTLGMQQRISEEMQMIESLCPDPDHLPFVIWNELQSGLQMLRESEDFVKVLRWMGDYVRNLKMPLESVKPPPVYFEDALGGRSLFVLWARISGAWVSDATEKAKFEQEFHFALLRLKTLLTRGFSRSAVAGDVLCSSSCFFKPYLAMDEVSDYHLFGLSRSNAPCVLQLGPEDPKSTLGQLASLDTMHQLTTLDVVHVPTTPEFPDLLLGVLEKHTNIVALSCPRLLDDALKTQLIQERVFKNREMWKEKASQRNAEFQYLVGFEADNPFGVEEQSNPAWELMAMSRTEPEEEVAKTLTAEQDVLCLHEGRVECLILVYTPTSGRVTFTFRALAEDYDEGTWKADGVQVEVRLKGGAETEWTYVTESRRDSLALDKPLQVVVELGKGDYEVRIRLSKSYSPDDFFGGNVVKLQGLMGADFLSDSRVGS